jgi:hypothetical protein
MMYRNVEAKQNFFWTQIVIQSIHIMQYIGNFHLYTLAISNISMQEVPNMSFLCAFSSTYITSVSPLNDVCPTLLNPMRCVD